VGVTGVGKSTFINLISDSKLEVGTSLKPCTTEVGPGNSFSLADREVILFDTPGFDDPKGDVAILKEIANFFCIL
jgi:GTPase Era involved in 16S rRNA processing